MTRSKAVAKRTDQKGKSKKKLTSQKISRKSAPVETGVKKRRWRPGTVAMREIKRYQKTTQLLMLKAPFQRKSKECCYFSKRHFEKLELRTRNETSAKRCDRSSRSYRRSHCFTVRRWKLMR